MKKTKKNRFNAFFNKVLPYFGVRGIRQHIVKRICSAIAIGSIFLLSIYVHKYLFMLVMISTMIGMITEWFDLVSRKRDLLLGLFLISISISIVILTRFIYDYRAIMLFFLCLWINDSFAMIFGKKIGGPKIAPTISPSKTYSGFISGMVATGICGALFAKYMGTDFYYKSVMSPIPIYLYASIIAFIAFFSDLLVSYFKRRANVKDTGTIIPGHGGVLDRFDSMILTGPTLILYLL